MAAVQFLSGGKGILPVQVWGVVVLREETTRTHVLARALIKVVVLEQVMKIQVDGLGAAFSYVIFVNDLC